MKKLLATLFAAVLAVTMGIFAACAPQEAPEEEAVTAQIYMPDGAPALALAKYMAEDTAEDGIEYHVVEATTIQTYVTGNAPAADLCVLPVNLAAKLLGTGETYQLLGTVTHGNLYILSTDADAKVETAADLQSLKGKTVGVIQIAAVPGLTFKTVLNKYNVYSWDGFDKTNKNVLDGNSFSFSVNMNNGDDIS
ncbi:MAG: hypothetical protein J6Z36_02795, partial [Clostridia bacterium]|nr:hypothetical protein [Clostridia bacterium]